MPNNIPINQNPDNYFPGLSLIQTNGKIGGDRNVFVNLVDVMSDNAQPHIGGKVMNPPKGPAKMWAGDLCEYRTTGHPNNLDPEVYLLRTFKVADDVSSSTTVYIEQLDAKGDPYRHKPFVGDVLMVAPDVIGGEGTAVKVMAVASTTVTIGGKSVKVWALTVSAAMSISKGDILVEAENFTEGTSATKKMLVKTINGIIQCDITFTTGNENISGIGVTRDGTTGEITSVSDDDFYKARYQWTPVLGGLMWIDKMCPMPQCVLDLNLCNIPGQYHVHWSLNGKKVVIADDTAAIASAVANVVSEYNKSGATDPTTSTAAPVGATYINTTDNGIFKCVAATTGDNPSYTWVELDVKE